MVINRPNYDDYDDTQYEQSIYPYCRDLETYCDELERHFNKCEIASNDYIQQLEKALDKACQLLQDIEKDNCVYCPLEDNLCVDNEERIWGHCKKEKWKEYLLKDEN